MPTLSEMVSGLLDVGMTQTSISREAGVDQGTISRIHRGVTLEPNYETGKSIERLYREKVLMASPSETGSAA